MYSEAVILVPYAWAEGYKLRSLDYSPKPQTSNCDGRFGVSLGGRDPWAKASKQTALSQGSLSHYVLVFTVSILQQPARKHGLQL